MEYNIHGGMNTITGDVERLEAHGGVLYVKGNVGTLVQHGGVMYDQRPSNRVEYRTDKMSDEERWKYKRQIEELQRRIDRSERECLKLREKLGKQETEAPDDDILVRRIDSLQAQLIQERKAHEQEVEELKWRLEAITDIANGRNRKLYEDETNGHYIGVTDDSLDVLFTLINDYIISNDTDLSDEYGIPLGTIKYLAKILRLAKSPEERHEARDRLKRHNFEIIERRGGDQGHNAQFVEMVSKDGKVLQTFRNAIQAAKKTGLCDKTIRSYCNSYETYRRYTKNGLTFRYKKQKSNGKETEKD